MRKYSLKLMLKYFIFFLFQYSSMIIDKINGRKGEYISCEDLKNDK